MILYDTVREFNKRETLYLVGGDGHIELSALYA